MRGDGKPRETALFFDEATSHAEAIRSLYRHLADERIVLHRRRLAGMGRGFLYDRLETDRGTIWVMYRMTI